MATTGNEYKRICQQSSITISGNITETGSGIPIAGASVFIANTSFGAVSGFRWKLQLKATLENGNMF